MKVMTGNHELNNVVAELNNFADELSHGKFSRRGYEVLETLLTVKVDRVIENTAIDHHVAFEGMRILIVALSLFGQAAEKTREFVDWYYLQIRE